MRTATLHPICPAALLLLGVASVAAGQYQWKAVPLHPAGTQNSRALAAAGARQGGTVNTAADDGRPVLWDGSAKGWTDLMPPGDIVSAVLYGMDEHQQVGEVNFGKMPGGGRLDIRAGLWSGSAGSFIDLHPSGYTGSGAHAVRAGQQVGYGMYAATGEPHALLWHDTPDSVIDLHPAAARWSFAYATDGRQQGGQAALAGAFEFHAALWNSTAESFVDLNPPSSVESIIRGMAPGLQVGFARRAGQNQHAAVWRGSADSYVDLNRPGSAASDLFATDGAHFVGWAAPSGGSHATIWLSDNPSDFVDLHALLPAGYSFSRATGVARVGDTLYITGYAELPGLHAWLWIGTIPAPSGALALGAGVVVACHRRRRC